MLSAFHRDFPITYHSFMNSSHYTHDLSELDIRTPHHCSHEQRYAQYLQLHFAKAPALHTPRESQPKMPSCSSVRSFLQPSIRLDCSHRHHYCLCSQLLRSSSTFSASLTNVSMLLFLPTQSAAEGLMLQNRAAWHRTDSSFTNTKTSGTSSTKPYYSEPSPSDDTPLWMPKSCAQPTTSFSPQGRSSEKPSQCFGTSTSLSFPVTT
jgi:hypothetical protein